MMSVFHDVDPRDLQTATLSRLRRLVELESPSGDEASLRAIAAVFAAGLAELGAEPETVDAPGVGEHVVGRLPGAEPGLDPLMILGHLDTVHPAGTFDPVFQVDGGRARGPGTYDMKGGWACMLEALDRLTRTGGAPRRPLLIVATCDEETGSETSRSLIEELARGTRAVLVPEPPAADGSAKTSRKGVAWYRLTARGRASHAGLAPEAGINAVVELAHQVLAITALANPAEGTTVSIGEIEGGTASNVVPARASAVLDVRFTTGEEAERVEEALRGLVPVLDGAALELVGGVNRPPMERTDGIVRLYEQARAIAAESGWQLGETPSGGASDGSLTTGVGIPTLDGIGPRGGGAHAADEHVRVDDLSRRVTLYGRLMETL